MSQKRHEAPRKVSSKTESFGCILKIPSRKRREKYNTCIGEIPTLKPIFSVWILLIYVHEAPRKVLSKTEPFGCILKIPSRKRHEKYNACIGEIPTLKTNFFCLDPPNICSRSTM